MIVEPDFLTHWKTQMLIDELDGDKLSPLYLIALWAHCQQRKSETFHNMAPNALKSICRYEGEASKLRSALERCGWIEVQGEAVTVHGWAETNGKLVANWTNGKFGGRPKTSRKKTQQKPNDNPHETQLEVGVTHTKPIEKRREEKRREETTHTPDQPALQPPWDSEQCVCVFDSWFSYLAKHNRTPLDRPLASVMISRMFTSPVEFEQAAMAAMANGWLSVSPSMIDGGRQRGSTAGADLDLPTDEDIEKAGRR